MVSKYDKDYNLTAEGIRERRIHLINNCVDVPTEVRKRIQDDSKISDEKLVQQIKDSSLRKNNENREQSKNKTGNETG